MVVFFRTAFRTTIYKYISKDKKREEATLRRHSFFKQNSMMFR